MPIILPPDEYGRANLVTSLYRPQNPADRTIWKNPATGQDEIFSNGSWQILRISGIIAVANGGTGAADAAGARTNLGIGTLGQQNADNVNFSGKVRLSSQRAIDSSSDAQASDRMILATGGAGGISYTLPTSPDRGQQIVVIKVDAGAGVVTVLRSGSQTIQGATSIILAGQYEKAVLEYSDTGDLWYRLV